MSRGRGKGTATERFFRAEFAIDRTGIAVRDTVPFRARAAAWAAIAALYALGWTRGVQNAFTVVLGIRPAPATWPQGTIESHVHGIIQQASIAALAGVLIWAFRRYAAATPPAPPGWRVSTKTFVAAYAAFALGGGVTSVLSMIFGLKQNNLQNGDPAEPINHILGMLDSGMAGPAEELALMALVVVALRATGHRWATVYVVAIVLRVPFHLYYGWGAVGLAVWAAGMIYLYKRTGAIVAIIAEHASFNMLNYIGDLGYITKTMFLLSGVLVILLHIFSGVHRADRQTVVDDSTRS